ncbi:MAG: hypothetical protein ACJ75B_00230 [Flavisolibacter sp.]
MKNLLETVQQQQLSFVHSRELNELDIFSTPAKISRGENYLGLPWLILDYPRTTSSNSIFFIRTMFWWGKFFSSTLHLSGQYKMQFEKLVINSFEKLAEFYLGVSEDPWVHHFETSNYKKIGLLNPQEFETICKRTAHLKIAAHWPLSRWMEADEFLLNNWKFLIGIAIERCGM